MRKGGNKGDSQTVDHKIPRCRGGEDELENNVLACLACNRDKGRLTLDEYKAIIAFRTHAIDEILATVQFYGERKGRTF